MGKNEKTPIIAIGASAGGLSSLEKIFKKIPSDIKAAFVVIMHLAPDRKSILSNIISRHTDLSVKQAEDGEAVLAGYVYVIPPNKNITVKQGKIQLIVFDEERQRLPLDTFLKSLKKEMGDKGIAIILSGLGSDGTSGIRNMKEEGGLIVVQEPQECEYDAMPRHALETGLVDVVLPAEEIGQKTANFITDVFENDKEAGLKNDVEKSLDKIFQLLFEKTGHDFSSYKRTTIQRRIERRIVVYECDSFIEYLEVLQKEEKEVQLLKKELLISVTSFFRDPEVFQTLEKKIVPAIFQEKLDKEPVRIWVPACATGEEAYTLAIIFYRYMKANNLKGVVQIFATDIDQAAIETARKGYYNNSLLAEMPSGVVEQYFTKSDDGYKIKKYIRDLIVFAEQNILQQPPYSRLDLVSCRNLLIYLNVETQKKALSICRYALLPKRYLVLGKSETVGKLENYFNALDRQSKIYQKNNWSLTQNNNWHYSKQKAVEGQVTEGDASDDVSLEELTQKLILGKYVPSCVLVNSNADILYFQGKTGKYLEQPSGRPTSNLQKSARSGLQIPFTNAFRKAQTGQKDVVVRNLKVQTNGNHVFINLTISPVPEKKYGDLFLVVFEELDVREVPATTESDRSKDENVAELENELQATQEYLQNTIEKLETSNEELKSINDEAHSSNEELQSTNEELETSKEEIQSVNEELTSTNAELQDKIGELNKANNDLINLLNSTQIATVFLNKELKISRFTPAFSKIIELLQSDIGRSFKHFADQIGYKSVEQDSKQVLEELIPKNFELTANNDLIYWVKIMPYRTLDDNIEGVVITFTDITEKKEYEKELLSYQHDLEKKVQEKAGEIQQINQDLREEINIRRKVENELLSNKERFSVALQNSKVVVAQTDTDLRYTWVYNPHPDFDKEAILGKTDEDIFEDAKAAKQIIDLRKEVLQTNKAVRQEIAVNLSTGTHYYDFYLQPQWDHDKSVKGLTSVAYDITEQKKIEHDLKESQLRYQALFENSPLGILVFKDGAFVQANRAAQEILGAKNEQELIGTTPQTFLVTKGDSQESEERYQKILKDEKIQPREYQMKRLDGSLFWSLNMGIKAKIQDEDVLIANVLDITRIKEAEEKLTDTRNLLLEAEKLGAIGSWVYLHQENKVWWSDELFALHGLDKRQYENMFDFNLDDTPLWEKYIHPEDLEKTRDLYNHIAKKGKGNLDYRVIRADTGEVRFMLTKARTYYNKKGELTRIGGVTQDITERKKSEESLKRAMEELEAINASKDRLFSIISHDLQSPFNNLASLLDLIDLSDNKKEEIDPDLLRYIGREVQTGRGLLENLLDWSRSQAGRLTPSPEELNLLPLFDSIIQLFEHNITSKELTVDTKIDTQRVEIYADKRMLNTVLRNLLSNAIKFTTKGQAITLGNQAGEGEDEIVVFVKDEGIGMTKEQQQKLFSIEKPLSTLGTNNERGTGLGLTVCKEFVEKWGGKFWLESETGKGTTFYFTVKKR